jgi:tetratricopeptide (TPR) repeat protein
MRRIYPCCVAEGALAVEPEYPTVDELLQLAVSRPHDAIARARKILSARPGPREASIAHQAAGIVLRDIGDVSAGVRELRRALKLARLAGSADREAEVLGSLGTALVHAGQTADGLAALDRAIGLSTGPVLGRALHMRGVVLYHLGRFAAALADLQRAVSVLSRAGDQVWTARALSARALAYLYVGSTARADADFVAAGLLYAQTSQELESVHTVLNRGWAAFVAGDLPAALSLLDEAAARYRSLNVPTPSLTRDRCNVLLAAGLIRDALAEADAAVREIERAHGRSTIKAELLLTAAICALAAQSPLVAIDRAQAARRLFRSQQNAWGQAHALLVLAEAQFSAGPPSARLLHGVTSAANRLEDLGSGDAVQARLLAGRVALELGRLADADRHLTAAARSRRRGQAMSRVTGWLSEALRAEAAADPRRSQAACRRGLEILDEHRWTLGASELRALATAHGAELAALAQRHAARAHQPRLLFAWSERWRATALAVPPVRLPEGGEFDAGLAALRQLTGRLENARRNGSPTVTLEREQLRLEKTVRASSLRARGISRAAGAVLSIPELLRELGETQLIEIVDVDGTVHVLICRAGRVRQFTAGRTRDAISAADFARFALRRLARGRPGDDLDSATAILKAAGPRLQDAIVGPAAALLGDEPVVIVPPGRLHAIPWALLPVLGGRKFSVAPSALAWQRAHRAPPPADQHVVLARGPGLVTDGAEVPLVARLYDDVTSLSGHQATAGQVLSALDGAWIAHIAAHGTFRADSPLFSSLRMHDGPLTVYDFEQLHRAPHRLVLSSCDSGVQAPVGADELLGLVSSLLPLGTAGIVASVVPLNDDAVVPVMVNLHQCLRAGQDLAESLCSVRRAATGHPLQHAAALSLLTFGAG